MEPKWIAKIINRGAIGTAYPIGPNLLLTAAHVVEDVDWHGGGSVSVEWPDLKDSNNKSFTAVARNIAFDGKLLVDGKPIKCDLVVLDCELPIAINQKPPSWILSQKFAEARTGWKAAGYPNVNSNILDTATGLSNADLEKPEIKLTLDDTIDPTVARANGMPNGWGGMSGAPVFDIASGKIQAIITDHNQWMQKQLIGVSIPYLIRNSPGFCQAVGINAIEPDFSKAIAHLQEKPDARKLLFAQIAGSDATVVDTEEAIVAHLTQQLSIPELLSTVHEVQSQARNQAVFAELATLVRLLLPSLYEPGIVSGIRSSRDDSNIPILEIPFATDISAEILMASADGRPAEFRVFQLEYGRQVRPGKFRLALPPESGATSVDQQMNDVDDDLHNRLARGDVPATLQIAIDDHLFKKNPRQQRNREYSQDDKRKLNHSWLAVNAKSRQPGFYWLLRQENNDNDFRQGNLASELKRHYPQITLLGLKLDTDQEIREFDLFDKLADTQIPD